MVIDRRLSGRQARDRYSVGRTTDVVESNLIAERNRRRIASVLATDPALEALCCCSTLGDAHFAGDVRHLGSAIALGDEDPGRADEQVFEAVLGDGSRHGFKYN